LFHTILEQPIVTEGMNLPEQGDDDDDAEAESIPTRTGEASSLPEDSENQGDDADDDDDDSWTKPHAFFTEHYTLLYFFST